MEADLLGLRPVGPTSDVHLDRDGPSQLVAVGQEGRGGGASGGRSTLPSIWTGIPRASRRPGAISVSCSWTTFLSDRLPAPAHLLLGLEMGDDGQQLGLPLRLAGELDLEAVVGPHEPGLHVQGDLAQPAGGYQGANQLQHTAADDHQEKDGCKAPRHASGGGDLPGRSPRRLSGREGPPVAAGPQPGSRGRPRCRPPWDAVDLSSAGCS